MVAMLYAEGNFANQSIGNDIALLHMHFHVFYVHRIDVLDGFGNFLYAVAKGIIEALDLRKPIYSATSAYGHFGREPKKNGKGTLFTWERLDRVSDLKKAVESR